MSERKQLSEYLEKVRKREDELNNEFMNKGLFNADVIEDKPKFFVTFPYPYMNGSLHLGHAYSAGRLDVIARYKRLKGYNVLYPWAWHWTGEAVYGTVYRIRINDQDVINRLIELDRVEPDKIHHLKDPVKFVRYFTDKNRIVAKKYGLMVDWRREFHTTNLHPLYNKFIEWQIKKLYEKGYITKGTHPIVWCPTDQSPTGDHDRLTGEGVRPEEYFLVKFRLEDGIYVVAGTLRPETIYGATNIWINPEGKYVLIDIDGEKWVVSEEASFKLENQLHKVKVIKKIEPDELLGKVVEVPLVKRIVPILPAEFVDTDVVTGVVYSVPAHAPYDYVALLDLRDHPSYGDIVRKIHPISIIKVDGYGEYPAIDVVESMGIKTQNETDKLDEATKEVYSVEYHRGVMKENTGPISGMEVSKAKEIIKSILIDEGLGAIMYDLPEPVICRCTTKCIVKILPDQWFLKYSDREWKKLAHKAVLNMKFYPPEIRELFDHYIDWYHDWPCTRRTGLGTPFPFDKSWIVETLTDSTIYNAFYIVAKYYNEGLINPEKIDDGFFDYIYLGIGDVNELSSKYSIEKDILERIRKDFEYWYPVDLRASGKDLIGNHLTFYIFHHVAIFPPDKWPKGIAVNGFMKLNGRPMSKSKGNYMSLETAIEKVGVDALRLSLLSLVDGLDDPDWSLTWAYNILSRLSNLESIITSIWSNMDQVDNGFFDSLIYTHFYNILDKVDESIEKMEIAKAARLLYFDFLEKLKTYYSFVKTPSKGIMEDIIPKYVILISMYTPYVAEYLWREILKKPGYAFKQSFPEKRGYDVKYLAIDKYISELVEDIHKILELVKGEVSEIVIVVSNKDKWNLFRHIFSKFSELNMRGIMNFVRKSNVIDKKSLGQLSKFLNREWYGRYMKYKDLLTKYLDSELEYQYINEILPKYLRRSGINYKVRVVYEDEYKGRKQAHPLYPAIYLITR